LAPGDGLSPSISYFLFLACSLSSPLQSEVELEDAVVDLVMGPADERETNTLHAMHAEEEEILG
jgi:hypothetical protein